MRTIKLLSLAYFEGEKFPVPVPRDSDGRLKFTFVLKVISFTFYLKTYFW
jgi:hypothetical protein